MLKTAVLQVFNHKKETKVTKFPGCKYLGIEPLLQLKKHLKNVIKLLLIVFLIASCMESSYEITPKILKLISIISEKLGEINANFLDKPSPTLRKQNRIKTIHSSLKIEGNTLTEEQITALLEHKRVVGSKKDIQEI